MPDAVGLAQAGGIRHPTADPQMTRTNNTARASKVRTIKVNPETLASADLSAAELPQEVREQQEPQRPAVPLPARMERAAARMNAKQVARKTRKEPEQRVSLTADEQAILNAIEWTAPKVGANLTITPKAVERFNRCKGERAYDLLAEFLIEDNTVTMVEVAQVWINYGDGNARKTCQQILQQAANRAGVTLQQRGLTFKVAA